jgi:hypothetical protein
MSFALSELDKIGKEFVFLEKRMVRPGGFELPTFWFLAARSTLPNLARGVANRTDSASWGKFSQTTFSFICCRLPHFCRRFLQFALHFRDSYQIERKCMSYGHLPTLMIIQHAGRPFAKGDSRHP